MLCAWRVGAAPESNLMNKNIAWAGDGPVGWRSSAHRSDAFFGFLSTFACVSFCIKPNYGDANVHVLFELIFGIFFRCCAINTYMRKGIKLLDFQQYYLVFWQWRPSHPEWIVVQARFLRRSHANRYFKNNISRSVGSICFSAVARQ